jgi:hypothetical protein
MTKERRSPANRSADSHVREFFVLDQSIATVRSDVDCGGNPDSACWGTPLWTGGFHKKAVSPLRSATAVKWSSHRTQTLADMAVRAPFVPGISLANGHWTLVIRALRAQACAA